MYYLVRKDQIIRLSDEKEEQSKHITADRLLRSLGASGKYIGFRYVLYMIELVMDDRDNTYQMMKTMYPMTAEKFSVTPETVERATRTLIQSCWDRADHSAFNTIAGAELERRPTNKQFIDMMAAYLREVNRSEP